MKVTDTTVELFLDQWGNYNTRRTYASTLDNFKDFCGGVIETGKMSEFVRFLESVGASLPVVYRAQRLIPELAAFARGQEATPISRLVRIRPLLKRRKEAAE